MEAYAGVSGKWRYKPMKKIRVTCIILSTFVIVITFSPICKAEVSPFKPDWQIGDSWKMEFTERSQPYLTAAMEFIEGDRFQYGDFSDPSTYIFTVTGKKEIKGEECFEVEMSEQYPDKEMLIMRLYYTTDTLKVRLAEEILEEGRRLPDYTRKDGPILEPYSTSQLPLSWPDFSQLDPANSPQVFGRILQEVSVVEDTLTINWRLGYNPEDGSYGPTWQQTWRGDNPWWSDMKIIASDGLVLEKAHVTFGPDLEPPDLSLTVIPDTLWPPEHRMVEITPHITVSDNEDESPELSLDSVTSSEPDDAPGAGDGHTTGDIKVTDEGKIFLRAERAATGDGRIYTITYTATDASGNTSSTSAIVTVPRDVGEEKKK